MGQRPDRVNNASFDETFDDEIIPASDFEEYDEPTDVDEALAAGDAEIQETREEIGHTLEAIQAKLQPERLTEDVKNMAQDTVDHLLEESKSTAGEVSEIASVAAMEAVDYATKKIQELLPDLRQQAQDAANEAVTHAVSEAKAAVQEMSENARAAMRDATIGRIERMTHTTTETSKYVGSTAVQRIKQNPGPAALAALGITWLFMGGKGSGTQSQAQTQIQPEYGTNQSSTGSMMETASSVGTQVQETASDVVGTVAGQVQGGMDTAMNQVHQVADQAQHMASDAATTVQQSAGQAASAVKQVPSRTRSMVEENPMPLGLVALALGSAAALVIPNSRKENQIMGEARDALMETAKSKGHEVAEKAQDMVEGMQTTMENVEEMVTEKSDK